VPTGGTIAEPPTPAVPIGSTPGAPATVTPLVRAGSELLHAKLALTTTSNPMLAHDRMTTLPVI